LHSPRTSVQPRLVSCRLLGTRKDDAAPRRPAAALRVGRGLLIRATAPPRQSLPSQGRGPLLTHRDRRHPIKKRLGRRSRPFFFFTGETVAQQCVRWNPSSVFVRFVPCCHALLAFAVLVLSIVSRSVVSRNFSETDKNAWTVDAILWFVCFFNFLLTRRTKCPSLWSIVHCGSIWSFVVSSIILIQVLETAWMVISLSSQRKAIASRADTIKFLVSWRQLFSHARITARRPGGR
jgi:hypothetical protein